MNKIVKIGMPGKFDVIFGLMPHWNNHLVDPLWTIVWLDTGKPVAGLGSFFNPIDAESYVKYNRITLLDKEIENILLINE